MKSVLKKLQSARGARPGFRGSAPPQVRIDRFTEPMRLAGNIVHAGVFNSVKDVLRIEFNLVQLVSATVRDGLIAGGQTGVALGAVIHSVVRGAISATHDASGGTDLIARSIAKGIVLGVHEVGGDVIIATFETTRALVRLSAATGADLARVAQFAIGGVIEAGAEIGVDVSVVASQAAYGAIDGAGDISTLAMATLRQVVQVLAGRSSALAGEAGAQSPVPRAPMPR